ncbi:MAG: AMP-binding protein [Spirochaetales bacterium]|nr:AMP-binding protein [Spirochaetales bacterium]
MTKGTSTQLMEVASRIKEMREIMGFSVSRMAELTEVSESEYLAYESGSADLPFSFIHKCAVAFGVELTTLLEGDSAKLSLYTVTRKGQGQQTAKEDGINIQNLAPKFRSKIAEPYWVRYEYSEELQDQPIALQTHSGQEFDLILSGSLLVQVGKNKEVLHEGDSIYYNSSTPHGMIAVEGRDCVFVAVVMPGEDTKESDVRSSVAPPQTGMRKLLCEKYADFRTDRNGAFCGVDFKNTENFNFAYDVVDALATRHPDKLAIIWLDREKNERRFTFEDMKKNSARVANYFLSLGIRKGDRVMLVLKRHYQFWFSILALSKIGAVAIPATYQLKEHDFIYRFNTAGVSAIICTSDGDTADIVDRVTDRCPTVKTKVIVGARREGWRDFDSEYPLFKSSFRRTEQTPGGDDIALAFFSSGTSGNPKLVEHRHTYPLGHFPTARFWHGCRPDSLHLTISDTGWGKSLWGKLYGQWMCEGAVFVYDFDRFSAPDILPLFAKYKITSFCAPPTILRMMVKEDLSGYDFSSVRDMTTAGEALNPEVALQFRKATGLTVREGFGQTETTLTIANFLGDKVKTGSMGRPSPQYNIALVDHDGNPVADGEVGEIVIDYKEGRQVGLFSRYVGEGDSNLRAVRDGWYHTGDTAWRDEDGYYYYVGRVDDIIKSSGYRIGPFEVESVIMELPYVLECGVSAAPDPIRGQIVKASIVLVKGKEPTEALKKEIQDYVKAHTAPYKYPRLVVFRDELPKTISGKIIRSEL